MELTLKQVAAQLGKSVRQVRYMIQSGTLPARKSPSGWLVDSAALPASPRQGEAAARKQRALRAAVEDVLSAPDTPGTRRYSLRNLRAVQVALPIRSACEAALGASHAATQSLYQTIEHIIRGCHRFARGDKAEAYRLARDEASRSTCSLLIDGSEPALRLLDQVEQELLPAISGLLRRQERRMAA